MFTHKHYVPILKAKDGEFKALSETYSDTKNGMTPLFEIVDVPWDYVEEKESKTIEAHLDKVPGKILDCWGENRHFFVDSNYLSNDRLMSDGTTHHMTYLFEKFRKEQNLLPTPTTGFNRTLNYKRAIKTISDTNNLGICLRVHSQDLVKPNIKAVIDNELNFYSLEPQNVDLIIDLGSIVGGNADVILLSAITFINSLPYLNEWRTLTLSATGFPTDLSEVKANTVEYITRTEWHIWNSLLVSAIKRIPSFGDYTIAHPDTIDIDPRLITISASIRYTCDDSWLIVRGKSTKTDGWEQYHALCERLISLGNPPYCGDYYSWGDDYINKCALPNPTVGTGNSTTWRKVANNHHIQKVITQISSLV